MSSHTKPAMIRVFYLFRVDPSPKKARKEKKNQTWMTKDLVNQAVFKLALDFSLIGAQLVQVHGTLIGSLYQPQRLQIARLSKTKAHGTTITNTNANTNSMKAESSASAVGLLLPKDLPIFLE